MKRILLFLLLATVARGATYDYPVKTATNALSASKALTTDANGKAAASATTSTEIGYVSGVTSAIQTQLDAKGAATNGTFSGGTFTGSIEFTNAIVYGPTNQTIYAVDTNAAAEVTRTIRGTAGGIVFNHRQASSAAGYPSWAAGNYDSWLQVGASGSGSLYVSTEGASSPEFTFGNWGSSPAPYLRIGATTEMGFSSGPMLQVSDLRTSGNNFPLQLIGRSSGGVFVGIGNTNTAGTTILTLQETTGGTPFHIKRYGSTHASANIVEIYNINNAAMKFGVSNAEQAQLTTTGMSLGAVTPAYRLDINGQARILGTNGMRFGGTSGATDDTVTVWQPSANVARITASSRTEVTGPMMIGSTGAPAGHVEVLGANNSTSLLVMGTPGTASVDTLQIKQGGSLKFSVTKDSSLAQPGTITTPGTTGAQTINKPIGTVNLAAGATSLVVTDSVCLSATNCIVFGQVLSNDTTCKSVVIVVGTGSFTIYPDAAPTAETVVAFQVLKIQ